MSSTPFTAATSASLSSFIALDKVEYYVQKYFTKEFNVDTQERCVNDWHTYCVEHCK